MLNRLKDLRPDLHAEISRRAADVCAPAAQRPLAVRLRFAAARKALEDLRSQGAVRLGVAGPGPFWDDLCAAGLPDGLEFVAAAGVCPSSVLGPDGRLLTATSPGEASGAGLDGVLVLSPEALPAAWEGLPRAEAPGLVPGTLPFSLTEAQRPAYDAWRAAVQAQAQAKIQALGDPSRVVLFAGIYAYFNFDRLSLSLRRRGLRTVFLCLNPSNQAFRGDHFDLCLHGSGDLNVFFGLLAAENWKAVHYQGWLNLHLFALAARELVSAPFVCEFNDLVSMLYEEDEFDRLFGLGSARADQESVDELSRKCDGLVLNYAGDAPDLLLPSSPPPHRQFHSWPLSEFFAAAEPEAGPVRLVFTGMVNASHYPDPAFGDVKLLGLARLLASQGVELHLFLNPYQALASRGAFWDYQYLAQREPRFHIHAGLPPEELPGAIAGMHYGSMLYLFPEEFTVKPQHLACIMPTKFFGYLEAGLPVLLSEEFTSLARLVREHGLGAVLNRKDMNDMGRVLDGLDILTLRSNVRRFRESHGMHAQSRTIESLYNEVAARRRKQKDAT